MARQRLLSTTATWPMFATLAFLANFQYQKLSRDNIDRAVNIEYNKWNTLIFSNYDIIKNNVVNSYFNTCRHNDTPTHINSIGGYERLRGLFGFNNKSRFDAEVRAVNNAIDGKYTSLERQILFSREYQLHKIQENNKNYDIIVIGGGATGAGVFLDLVTRFNGIHGSLIKECMKCGSRVIVSDNNSTQQTLPTSRKQEKGVECDCVYELSNLKILLLERNDFSSGTSSKSTKLLHGGVRYLEAAFWGFDIDQLHLVYEALDERSTLLNICPYLNKPLPILMPVYNWFKLPYYWVGAKAYDIISGRQNIGWSYYLTPSSVLDIFPQLKNEKSHPNIPHNMESHSLINDSNGSSESIIVPLTEPTTINQELKKSRNFGEFILHYWGKLEKHIPNDNSILNGGIVYFDGQMNDSRMNLNIILTAMILGGNALNYAAVTEFIYSDDVSNSNGKITGIKVNDDVSGIEYTIEAGMVINCTGPYTDQTRRLINSHADTTVIPSAGAHIVLDSNKYGSKNGVKMGLLDPVTSDGRLLFVLPWLNKTVAGTTDVKCSINSDIKATSDEVGFIISEINSHLFDNDNQIDLTDVRASWAGMRPLVLDIDEDEEASGKLLDSENNRDIGVSIQKTQQLARTHKISYNKQNHIITVAGGKWTTYRRMGEETVDLIAKVMHWPDVECKTKQVLLLGSHGYIAGETEREMCEKYNSIDADIIEHLVNEYGTHANDVLFLYTNDLSESLNRIYDGEIQSFITNGPLALKNNVMSRLYALEKAIKECTQVSLGKDRLQLHDRIVPDLPITYGEIFYNSTLMCSKLSDVVARRLRLAFLDYRETKKLADSVGNPLFAKLYPNVPISQATTEFNEFIESMKGGT